MEAAPIPRVKTVASWASDLCDTADGDTDDVISVCSWVTNEDWDGTGFCTDDLPLGPPAGHFSDDHLDLWTFRKVVVRRTFLEIDLASEKVECRPRALTDGLVRYGSDVHSDSGEEPTQTISLIAQTAETTSTVDDDESIHFTSQSAAGRSADDKSSVASLSTEAASTADGDEPIRSISFT